MSPLAEPFREEARRIVTKLLGERTDAPESLGFDVRRGLYLADIDQEARQFKSEATAIRDFGLDFPAVRAAEDRIVPVALATILPYRGFPFFWRYPFFPEHIRVALEDWKREKSSLRLSLNINAAMEGFRSGMVEFLATRIYSVENFFESGSPEFAVPTVALRLPETFLGVGRIATVGFTVNVNALTAGLRIHVSPTFWRNWRFFGTPTNPVVNTLTGGIYEFGADGGPYGTTTITPDSGTFDIPYQTTSPFLNL